MGRWGDKVKDLLQVFSLSPCPLPYTQFLVPSPQTSQLLPSTSHLVQLIQKKVRQIR